MEVTRERTQRIWQELKSRTIESEKEQKLEGEKTIREFAEEAGITYEYAKKTLNREVREGRLKMRKVKIHGLQYCLYSPIEKEQN